MKILTVNYQLTLYYQKTDNMNHLTERERIEILMIIGYGDRKRSHQEACAVFNDTHLDRNPISKSTVTKTLKRFNQTGSVKNQPKLGRPRTCTNEENSLNILLDIVENPQTSVLQVALNHDMSRKSVQNILKRAKYHPYKIHLVHELNEDDFDRRLQFCETMMTMIDANENFVKRIVFSDEATFQLNGVVNRHNCRYWSDSNPHWMATVHTQHPQKVNVWAGIIGHNIIGPFFINGNLTAEKYLQLLRENIVPQIIHLFPNNNNQVWFQQDGAPPHYGREVRNYLNDTFPQKWIGRRGTIEWPARSPDLNPLDFFLWGYLKSRVYINKPESLDELKLRIETEIRNIPQNWLNNTIDGFIHRLHYCQEVNGEQFEHLL